MPRSKSVSPKISFPRDEGAHPGFLMEWWYGHFNLRDSEGREYGAMVAYFNFGLRIISISDLVAKRLYSAGSGSALHYVERKLDLRWGRDHWWRTASKSFSYSLKAYGAGLSLDLELVSEKPPLLACGSGLIEWTGGSSYYYSLTRLKSKGQIGLSERTIDVEGVGFIDHQWMNAMGEGGWDWFAVQLDDGIEMLFWRIIKLDGTVRSADLTIMFADNQVYHTKDFKLEKLGSWVSPTSGREYGVRWRLQEKSRGIALQIRAHHAQQEIGMFETLSIPRFYFWEGVTEVSGRLDGESVSGTGYAEFVRLTDQG